MSRRWIFSWSWTLAVVLACAASAQPPTNPGRRWDAFDPATTPLQSTDRILIAQGALSSIPNPFRAPLSAVSAFVVSGLVCRELDGAPSVASWDTLTLDQTDGFVVTDLGGGEARVDLAAIPDTALAGSYSGVGPCAPGEAVTTLNDNAAPTCAVMSVADIWVDEAGDTMTGNLLMSNAAGPELVNEAASATNPTLIPNRAELDDGIGHGAAGPTAIEAGIGIAAWSAGFLFVLDEQRLAFRENDANGTNRLSFKAPASVSSNQNCEFEDDVNFIPASCVSPAGTTLQVMFNNAGDLAGDAGFVFEPTTNAIAQNSASAAVPLVFIQQHTADDPGSDVAFSQVPPPLGDGSWNISDGSARGSITWPPDDSMVVKTGGTNTAFTVDSSGNLMMGATDGPAVLNETAAFDNPTLVPNKNEPGTGIGWDATDGCLYLDSEGVEIAAFCSATPGPAGVFNLAIVGDSLQSETCADNAGGTAAALTITPVLSFIQITNSDPHGCDITISEAEANIGQRVELVVVLNAGGTVNFADTAGVTEIAGAFAADVNDSLSLRYAVNRFVQSARSDN